MRRFLISIVAIALGMTALSLASFTAAALESPYMPDATPPVSLRDASCGFVETTWDDPDWVFASSDLILRSSVCLAPPDCFGGGYEEYWFDRTISPCRYSNRYWKFPEDSGSGYAYPMVALGVGSFDGMYIRRTVKFQLYSGTGDGSPFGPEMQGPKYISIDHWGQYFPECGEFEPGTFLIAGGPDALSTYSIKIGLDTEITHLDLKKGENTAAHNTNLYPDDDFFVLRRGATFDIEVTLSESFGTGCHEIYMEAYDEFEAGNPAIEIPPSENAVPPNQWGAQTVSVITNPNMSRKALVRVTIPGDVAAGIYTFKVLLREAGQPEPLSEADFLDPVALLFNPWSTEDAVYLASDSERTEYVLRTTGNIWRGSRTSNGPMNWGYSTFHENTLWVALDHLSGLDAATRANPGLVARSFSSFINSNGGGMLTGRWDGNYAGGRNPSYWSSSGQIINEYVSNGGNPVAYGQCWVFGGLMTTFLRTMGIPGRPLTNFESAHDSTSPADKNVDFYYSLAGTFIRNLSESVWNFHVWCDAWLGAWNAVDATPQEPSGGEMQLGPAPLTSVLGDLGGAYDVDFVFGEVNADVRYYRELAGGGYALVGTNTTRVGHNMTTRAVGGGASDITALYKVPEVPLLRDVVSALQMTLDCLPSIELGDNITGSATAENIGGTEISARVVAEVIAIGYNGEVLGSVEVVESSFSLSAGATESVSIEILPVSYIPWTSSTRFFDIHWFLEDVNTEDAVIETCRVQLIGGGLLVELDADDIVVGSATNATVTWNNPFDTPATDVELTIATTAGVTIGGGQLVTLPLSDVPAHGTVQVSEAVTGVGGGSWLVSANLQCSVLTDANGSSEITVRDDCNNNGVNDSDDIAGGTSQDCNSNGIPDECELDCNSNGIPDECDIANETSEDCNGNGVPDICDLAGGGSEDTNTNGIPDECDPDCNDNGIPDDLDILNYTSSDFNHNGVPDECDEDCNENGVPDEEDIALGTSSDENGNGVPDECDINTPVFLSSFQVVPTSGSVSVHWELSIDSDTGLFRLIRDQEGSGESEVAWEMTAPGLFTAIDRDPLLRLGGSFRYTLHAKVQGEAWEILRRETVVLSVVPRATELYGAWPNPFNPKTTVRYSLAESGPVRISVHDLSGRRVATLLDKYMTAGEHDLEWSGEGFGNERLSSGVYFVSLVAKGTQQSCRVTLLK